MSVTEDMMELRKKRDPNEKLCVLTDDTRRSLSDITCALTEARLQPFISEAEKTALIASLDGLEASIKACVLPEDPT